jgi:hypothetical protein
MWARYLLPPMTLNKCLALLSDLSRFFIVRAKAGLLEADEEAHELVEVRRVVSAQQSNEERVSSELRDIETN